jgi:hypothetical protein
MAVNPGGRWIVLEVVSRDARHHPRRIQEATMSWTHRVLAVLALCLALATTTTAAAASAPSTRVEDQNDRLLRALRAEQAQQERTAMRLARSMEHNLTPVLSPGGPAAVQPITPTATATPRPGVGVLATLLVGLAGGLVGGCAAIAGWTATTRRRLRRPASAT